jgi:hypothetical protein
MDKSTAVAEVVETVATTPLNKKILLTGAAVLVAGTAVYVVAKIRAKKKASELGEDPIA